MKHTTSLLVGLSSLVLVGFASSCGEQTLEPGEVDSLEIRASLTDSTILVSSIPVPPPDSGDGDDSP